MSIKLSEFCFGAPDAETESTIDGGNFLKGVFYDPFNISKQITEGKFVISGRKGTGKSEFFYYLQSDQQSDKFVTILKYKKFDSDKIIALLNNEINEATLSLLWRWIILCAIFEQIGKDNSIRLDSNKQRLFERATRRIKGYANLDGFQVLEIIKKEGGEISLSVFKEIANMAKSKSFETKSTQIPILQLVPLFEELIFDIYDTTRDIENKFYICIDDLDEGYEGSVEQKRDLAILLKVAKDIHTKFNQKNIRIYPLISIRTDILNETVVTDANLHKITGSNTQYLNWYNHAMFRDTPDVVPLKTLILSRIRKTYNDKGRTVPGELFDSLFREQLSNDYNKDNFKYILDGTLYRPRDLIMIFDQIKSSFPNHIHISKDEYSRVYKRDYVTKKVQEWQGELLAFFNLAEIDNIFKSLKEMVSNSSGEPTDLKTFGEYVKKNATHLDEVNVAKRLYDIGVLCNIRETDKGRRFNWVYRTEEEDANYYEELDMVFHTVIREKYRRAGFFGG